MKLASALLLLLVATAILHDTADAVKTRPSESPAGARAAKVAQQGDSGAGPGSLTGTVGGVLGKELTKSKPSVTTGKVSTMAVTNDEGRDSSIAARQPKGHWSALAALGDYGSSSDDSSSSDLATAATGAAATRAPLPSLLLRPPAPFPALLRV